jgi:hypothetical protein
MARKSFSELYAEWLGAGWTKFTAKPAAATDAKPAADPEWKEERGLLQQTKKPETETPL